MTGCQAIEATSLLGKKWTAPLLEEISLNQGKGFNELFRRMRRISPKVLAQRLKELEAGGLLERKQTGKKAPHRTSYTLTTKGKELYNIFVLVKKWNSSYSPDQKGCEKAECVNCAFY